MAKGKEPTRRVALVTGGAKRVGRAIVEHLADRGFDVAFTYYLSGTFADEIAQKYEKGPARVVRIPGDLDDPESDVSRLLQERNAVRLKEELGTRPRFFYFFDE